MSEIELGTAYTWGDARTRGATRGQIARDGVRIGHGLYLSSAVEPDLATRCRAWRLVLPGDVAFSLGTAARLHGAPIAEPPTVHVVVPSRRQLPRRAGLTVHERLLAEEDVVAAGRLLVALGAEKFLELVAALHAPELLVMYDELPRARGLDGGHLTQPLATEHRWISHQQVLC